MKTIIITAVILFTTTILMGRSQDGYLAYDHQDFNLSEEAYINDIPFDTYMISSKADPSNFMMSLPEEEYVDDIPFNTACVAQQAMLLKLMCRNEECTIDDIPFDTRKIYADVRLSQWTALWQNEEYVDDIPFNTCYYSNCYQFISKMMPEYLNEESVQDICFKTQNIANQYLFNKALREYRNEEYVSDIPFEPVVTWVYDPRKDVLIYHAGAATQYRGIKGLNNIDFIIDMEKYMEEFNEKLRDMENLSFEYPF